MVDYDRKSVSAVSGATGSTGQPELIIQDFADPDYTDSIESDEEQDEHVAVCNNISAFLDEASDYTDDVHQQPDPPDPPSESRRVSIQNVVTSADSLEESIRAAIDRSYDNARSAVLNVTYIINFVDQSTSK